MKRLAWVVSAVVLGATAAEAQTLGTFRWQLQPFCNVLTVAVVQQGGQYQVDGTDDQCGAAQQASVVGRAFPNPDGSIGFGLTTVTTTNATAIHIDARLSVATLGGTWRDSAGNSGTFAFTPGAGTGGNPRPVPAGGIAPGTITGAQIAAGSITAAQLSPTAVAGSLGSCPGGQYLRGFLNGVAVCDLIATVPVSTTLDTVGFVGYYTSMAIGADGVPVIAHLDAGNQQLRVTHCSTPACTAAITTAADTQAGVGWTPAIAIGRDGRAIIAHSDQPNGDLRVTHCGNALCSVSTSLTVDSIGEVGLVPSIAIGADGFALIAHTDRTNHRGRVTHCVDVTCSSATSTSPIADFGYNPSIAVLPNGLPVIAYQSATELRIAYCADAVCSSATSMTLEPNPPGPDTVRLVLDASGRPVIAWADDNLTEGLIFCSDVACSTHVTRTLPVFHALALAIGSDGLPLLAAYVRAQGSAVVVRCNDATCATWTTATVDAAGDVGDDIALAFGADSLPVMSYRDVTNSDLRVTKCLSRSCQ